MFQVKTDFTTRPENSISFAAEIYSEGISIFKSMSYLSDTPSPRKLQGYDTHVFLEIKRKQSGRKKIAENKNRA